MSKTQSSEIRSLDQIPKGEIVEVVEVIDVVGVLDATDADTPGDDPIARRLGDLGIRKGTQIEVIRRAPLGDPTVYELRSYQLCLRRTESARIRVRPLPMPDRP